MITTSQAFIPYLRRLHERIRASVVTATEKASLQQMASVAEEENDGDTIYAIDRVSESVLIAFFSTEIATHTPILLIAEGLTNGKMILPAGTPEADVKWRVIVDPIDGTRGLMYQKRPAWILTGVAPNKGEQTTLADIELAMQTEIPLIKQHLSDSIWAVKGEGVTAVRYNRLTQQERPLTVRPSQATTLAHGFGNISRFFPGGRALLAKVDDALISAAVGPVQKGKALCFEDQYICSGGQLYELMAGHDRFIADLRPLLDTYLAQQDIALGICGHPYDLCTELIARELGIIVVNEQGNQLDNRLNLHENVTWLGYANTQLYEQIHPQLQTILKDEGLL